MWTPDVYQGAPTSVAALMSGGVKAASFAAFGRIALVVLGEAGGPFGTAVWWMAAATMVVGNVGALVQNDLKRMLAYSSIAHAGYLLMALAGIGAGGGIANENVGSLLFYAVAYTIMNAGTWAALSMFVSDGRDNTDISALSGLGRSQPVLAAMISLCLLSLAGIPPTIGFIGKFYLFSAAVEAGQVSLAIVGAISAAFGVYYYLRPMLYMYMRDGHPEVEDRFGWAAVTIGLCAAAILLVGVVPGPLLDWANASVRSVVG
jgi:NADH-quinone oxidoreductase subunit N